MKADRLSIELAEVRSRLMPGGWASALADVSRRLHSLKKAIKESPGSELARHVPVAAIAALETYFRSIIVDLVDRGEPYSHRAAKLIREKVFLSDAISWFHGKALTAGEVIARSASFNSVADLNSWLSTLLDVDLTTALQSAVDPALKRSGLEIGGPIVNDVPKLLADIQETFKIRHILAHEAAAQFEMTEKDASRLLDAVTMMVDGIDAVVWETANADVPLTQYEMNKKANESYLAAEAELEAILVNVAKRAGDSDWLMANQQKWKELCQDWIQVAYEGQMGSIWPLIAATEHERLVRQRIEVLRNWDIGIGGG